MAEAKKQETTILDWYRRWYPGADPVERYQQWRQKPGDAAIWRRCLVALLLRVCAGIDRLEINLEAVVSDHVDLRSTYFGNVDLFDDLLLDVLGLPRDEAEVRDPEGGDALAYSRDSATEMVFAVVAVEGDVPIPEAIGYLLLQADAFGAGEQQAAQLAARFNTLFFDHPPAADPGA